MEVLYTESRSNTPIRKDLLEKMLEKVKGKKVGLATTVQYLNQIKEIDEFLIKKGVVTLKENSPLCTYPCQILGCSVIEYDSDVILYLGTGKFHPVGLALSNDLPILVVNPETENIHFLDKEEVKKYKNKIEVNKTLVKNAKSVGILVSSKKGQSNKDIAENLKNQLENEGKEVYLFLSDTLDFNSFLNYSWIDAYINTACPRLFDDSEKFNKPLINILYYEKDSN